MKKLTRQQASMRNWGIMQLRGILPRFVQLIPEEVKVTMSTTDLDHLERIFKDIKHQLDLIKKPRKEAFLCDDCATFIYGIQWEEVYNPHSDNVLNCEHCNHYSPTGGFKYYVKSPK